jgi:hypothetical protein
MAHTDIQDQGLPSPSMVLVYRWSSGGVRAGNCASCVGATAGDGVGDRPSGTWPATDVGAAPPCAARAAKVRGRAQRLFHARRRSCWPRTPQLARTRRRGRASACSQVQAAEVRGRAPAHTGKAWVAQDPLASPPIAGRRPYLGFVGEELPLRSGCGSTREGGVWIR